MYFYTLCKRFCIHVKVFSLRYAVIELLTVLDRPISLKLHKPFSHRLLKAKERYILSWAKSFFKKEIDVYSNAEQVLKCPLRVEDLPIWICWLQGISNAPNFVKKLIKITQKNAGGHPIHLIDLNNYEQYCSIPIELIKKYESGLMPQQQFADILRSALLSQCGGLWIDASVYVVRPIPDDIFSIPIYNVKDIKPNYYRDAVVCDSTKWEAYFISSWPNSVTYSFIFDCFIKYWNCYDTLVDYFLFSYLAKLAREELPVGSIEYNQIPPNNYDCEQLSDFLMSRPLYSDELYKKILNGDTFIYKLSWKCNYGTYSDTSVKLLAKKMFEI